MSSLTSARGTLEGARVLDAFAGSGALGLETLSRGADHVTFCEQGRDAQRIIEANIASLGLPRSRYALRRGDAFSLPQFGAAAYDLVFLDPPYAFEAGKVLGLVSDLDAAGKIAPVPLFATSSPKRTSSRWNARAIR